MTDRSYYGYSKALLDETEAECKKLLSPVVSITEIYCHGVCKYMNDRNICMKRRVFITEHGCLDRMVGEVNGERSGTVKSSGVVGVEGRVCPTERK